MDYIHADSAKKDEKVMNKILPFNEKYRQYLPLIVFSEALMVLSIIVHILITHIKSLQWTRA